MRKGKEVIGLPVYAFRTGEEVAKIEDIFFDQNKNRVLGLLIDKGGWFSDARIISWENVYSIGPDAVVIQSDDVIVEVGDIAGGQEVIDREYVKDGTKILTMDGQDLGNMSDIFFDSQSGRIEGYEVSGGLFADAYTGRSFMPAPKVFKVGEDAAFVSSEVADLMAEQVDGIKGKLQEVKDGMETAAQSASETVQSAAESAKEQAKDAAVTAGETLQSASAATSEKLGSAQDTVSESLAKQTVDQALGRRVQQPVRTKSGLYIVSTGQIVTPSVVERAKRHNMEAQLLGAVGLGPTDSAKATVGESLSSAGDNVRTGSQELWDKVKDSAEQLKDKAVELQEQGQQKLEEERINQALGRPVTRVILDQDDHVILNTGEIVTHAAIDRARDAGTLGTLLSSILTTTPDLDASALRAPEPGEASLPDAKD